MPPLEVELEPWVAIREKVRCGYGFSYAGPHAWDATGWFVAPARALHRAFVQVELTKGPSVELEVRNLANATTETVPRNPLDPTDTATVRQPITDYVGYPMPGRSFLASVRWNL